MPEPSLYAIACDLAGPEPGDETPGPERPTVTEALAGAAPGQVVAARDGQRRVALVVLDDGSSWAVPDECPHDGGLLSDGFVDGDHLVCARHGWEFEVCSGVCPLRPRVRVASRPVARR